MSSLNTLATKPLTNTENATSKYDGISTNTHSLLFNTTYVLIKLLARRIANSMQEARNADAAIEGGRNLIVDGRKIRTEHAQARREYIAQNGDTGSSVSTGSVVLSRVSGGAVTREEAEELLAHYGPIEQMQPTTHQDKRLHGVPEGMWVKFAYYLDFKDAVKVSFSLIPCMLY